MLRRFVIGIGGAFVLSGAALELWAPRAWPAALELVIFGVLVLVGVFFERRYRGRTDAGAALQPTGERFIDPASGKLTQVLYDPKTGERIYRQIE